MRRFIETCRFLLVGAVLTSCLGQPRAERQGYSISPQADPSGPQTAPSGPQAGPSAPQTAPSGSQVDHPAPQASSAVPQSDPTSMYEPHPQPVYKRPSTIADAHFAENFDSASAIGSRWIISQAIDPKTSQPRYDGAWRVEMAAENTLNGDLGLVLKKKATHHALAAKLDRPFEFTGKPLIVQYEVKFQKGLSCGGAYIKLLAQQESDLADLDLTQFNDKTRYTIMFGPDRCGKETKLHFIFQHRNPITGRFEEKHAKSPVGTLDEIFTDRKTHLFTLVVKPDNVYEISIDQRLVASGSLLTDFVPAVNPPREIADPSERKPFDWDDREKIPDPDAKKPDDWDEVELIPDAAASRPRGWLDEEFVSRPGAVRPADWDDELDGEWEPPKITNPACAAAPGCGQWKRPLVRNPNYKGPWVQPLVDNPNYDGIWVPKMVANPDFFIDNEPYKMTPIVAIGFELGSLSDEILFDNILLTDDLSVAARWTAKHWSVKHDYELQALGGWKGTLLYMWRMGEKRPWLLGLSLVVLLLPFVIISVYCCPESGPFFKASDLAGREGAGMDGSVPGEDDPEAFIRRKGGPPAAPGPDGAPVTKSDPPTTGPRHRGGASSKARRDREAAGAKVDKNLHEELSQDEAAAPRVAPFRSRAEGARSKEELEGKRTKDGVEGTPTRDGVEGTPSRDGVEGTPTRGSVEGTSTRDGVEGTPTMDGVEGTPTRDGVEGTPTRDGARKLSAINSNNEDADADDEDEAMTNAGNREATLSPTIRQRMGRGRSSRE